MRLAISNIAWTPAQDDDVAAEMCAAGAGAVELAPTTIWSDPLLASGPDRRAVRDRWAARGLPIVALQSLLFGLPDLQLFEPSTRDTLRDRLVGLCALARDLGATRLVFGSPRNRLRRDLSPRVAFDLAVPFFREVGTTAEALGVVLCIEPNPSQYGCDFVNTAAEGRALVEAVACAGFGLHLDAAGLYLAGEDGPREVELSLHLLRHMHLSAPNLGAVSSASLVDSRGIVGALARGGYQGALSIEMRAGADEAENLVRVRESLKFASGLMRTEA